jgi:hypothetical protein
MNCPVSLYILLGQVSHVDDAEMKETTPAAIPPCWKIVCEPLSKQDKFYSLIRPRSINEDVSLN